MFQRIKRMLGFGASTQGPDYLLSDPRVVRMLGWGSERSTAGIPITAQTALTCSAWWRALNLLSDAGAKIPYGIYQNLPDGKGKLPDTSHPWNYALSKKPGDHWTAFQWRKLMIFWLASRGNAYSRINRDKYTLTPISPDELAPFATSDGRLFYRDSHGNISSPDEILHYKGLGYDGLSGYGILDMARESLGLNLAARRFQASTLKNDARPGIILKFPRTLKDDQKKEIRESWDRMHKGPDNASRMAIVDGGGDNFEILPFALKAQEIELIATQQWTVTDIANFTGVPVHKLGNKEGVSYNSLEQETLAWNTDTLEALWVNIEQEDEDKLLTEEQKQNGTHEIYFDRVRAAFASADLSSKSNYLRVALGGAPYMQISEARRMDNLNHVDGTDEIPQPANMSGHNNDGKPGSDGPGKPSAKLKEATAAALTQGCQRVIRRLGSQMLSAAKKGEDTFSEWVLNAGKNTPAIHGELSPLMQAYSESGYDVNSCLASRIVNHLMRCSQSRVHSLAVSLECHVANYCQNAESVFSFGDDDSKKKIVAEQQREENGQFGQGDGGAKFSQSLETAMQGKAEIGPRGFPIYKVDGKDYMVKQGQAYSKSEQMGSQYSKDAGTEVIEVREAKVQGRTVNAVAFQRDGIKDIGKMSETQKAEAVKGADRQSVERQALYGYAIGHTDPNDGNFFLKDNKMVGLDKDPSFSSGKDKSASFRAPEYMHHLGGRDFAFSKSEAEHMAGAAEKIADKLDKAGRGRDAKGVRARAGVLRTFSQGKDLSLGRLQDLGAGHDAGKSWISRLFGAMESEL